MSIKEYLKKAVLDFFIITTLVNFTMFLLGSLFEPEARFGYDAFLAPMVYAAFSLIPMMITYSPRELTVKEMMVRKAIQLALIEAILFLFVFGLDQMRTMEPMLTLSLGVSIAVVYVLVNLIEWLTDSKKAMTMTEELRAYQHRGQRDSILP